jgi:hypothetical protein
MVIDARKLWIPSTDENDCVYGRRLSDRLFFHMMVDLDSRDPWSANRVWIDRAKVSGCIPGTHGYKVCTAY